MIHLEYSKVYLVGLANKVKETVAMLPSFVKALIARRKALAAADFWLIDKASHSFWLLAMPNLRGNPEVTGVAHVSDGVVIFKGDSSLQVVSSGHGFRFTDKSPDRSKTWSMTYQEVLDVLVATRLLMQSENLQPGEWFTNREPAYSPRVRASKPPKVAKKRPKKPAKRTAKKQRKRSK